MVATTAAAKEESEDKSGSADPDKAVPQTAKSDVSGEAITDRRESGSPGPTIPGADPHVSSLEAVNSPITQVVR